MTQFIVLVPTRLTSASRCQKRQSVFVRLLQITKVILNLARVADNFCAL